MATTPTQSTLDLNSGKTLSTTETSTNEPGAESVFGRSPNPEPPILPATKYKAPTPFKGSPLKRSLSLDSPNEPEIIITRPSSPENFEYDVFKRSITLHTDTSAKPSSVHESLDEAPRSSFQ